MIKRAGLTVIAAIAAGMGLSVGADAGTRLRFDYFPFGPAYGDYYDAPYLVPAPRYYYYYHPRPRQPRAYAYQYEPEYYEPEVDPYYVAPRSRRTTALPQQDAILPQNTQKSVVPDSRKSGGISCDKATKIVSDYGFTQVKPTSCNGKVYAFDARRDGKAFAIKMSSASGELTEVKKH